MSVTFDVFEIGAMDSEARLRNLCKQLRHQAQHGWTFGYRGAPVRYCTESLPPGFSLLKNGKGPSAWVQIEYNRQPVTPKYRPYLQAEELYVAAAEAIDRLTTSN